MPTCRTASSPDCGSMTRPLATTRSYDVGCVQAAVVATSTITAVRRIDVLRWVERRWQFEETPTMESGERDDQGGLGCNAGSPVTRDPQRVERGAKFPKSPLKPLEAMVEDTTRSEAYFRARISTPLREDERWLPAASISTTTCTATSRARP